MTPSEFEHTIQKHLTNRNDFLYKACCEEEKAREFYVEASIAAETQEAKAAKLIADITLEKVRLNSKPN